MKEAIELLESKNIVGYNLDDVSNIISKLKKPENDSSLSLDGNNTRKMPKKSKKPSRKSAGKISSKPRKKRSTVPKKAIRTNTVKEGKENDEEDISYFKTWKVPYVEP